MNAERYFQITQLTDASFLTTLYTLGTLEEGSLVSKTNKPIELPLSSQRIKEGFKKIIIFVLLLTFTGLKLQLSLPHPSYKFCVLT